MPEDTPMTQKQGEELIRQVKALADAQLAGNALIRELLEETKKMRLEGSAQNAPVVPVGEEQEA